jgi:pimeloyl-ACP methyl ester carboxylesterase
MPKTPVVFVPGLGGSFNLLVLLDWRGPTLSGWDFPPFVDYGKTFVDAFTRAGYTRDTDLFVAFYDWRKTVGDSAANYLVPWIDRAKSRSGSGKVILVGHSMGGLVSRAYIQGNGYRGDVERLITLGTPHRGSADAYYPWEGGEIQWGGVASAVFNVYLWYLAHIHPFQSGLNQLKTIRTQAPGTRDLLPLDNYLQSQGPPLAPKPVASMLERNLLGDILLAPAGLDALLARVSLTTITGVGFNTLQSFVVEGPPAPPADPPLYVDGKPIGTQQGEGDGTVLLSSARIDDPRVRNRPSVRIVHDQLPDRAFDQVMAELHITPPAAVAAAAPVPRLVIMTASPVELTVEPPAAGPAVLGEDQPAPRAARRGRTRGRNYGHSGKHLNIAVIPQPVAGTYQVQLRGTATGAFALGALIVGVERPAVLSADEDTDVARQPAATPISTAEGQVAATTELHYQIEVPADASQPMVRFDAAATTRNALARLGDATRTPPPMVLGEESATPAPQVAAVLSAAEAPDDLRTTVTAALTQGDTTAVERLATMLRTGDADTVRLLVRVAEQVVGPKNRELALGLLEQLRQVVVGASGA